MAEKNAIVAVKKDVVDVVENKIKQFQAKQELDLPANYSPSNAMKSAWLVLQEVKDRNGKPAVEVCSKPSMANALLNMVVQGLNPAKNQCYFIVYGDQLVMQRSYFGTMHVAKTVCPEIEEIYSDVVYKDDEFEYQKVKGRTVIVKHTQKLGNVDPDKLIAAYCTIIYKDGSERSTIMTMAECKNSWRKSRMGVFSSGDKLNEKSTHAQFTAEMMKKTVTNRACKAIINASDDSSIMIARELESTVHQVAVEEEIHENANTVFVDIDDHTAEVDTDTGELIMEAVPVEDPQPEPAPANVPMQEPDF